jgi:hypothetical protein
MKEIIAVLIFCFVLFIYLHVYFHLKKCDDLEVYEICDPSKEKLEEVCDIRQPVVTYFTNDGLMENCNFNSIKANYGAFDVKIRNVKDIDDETELYVPLTVNESIELFKSDKDLKFLSERNYEFLEESGLIKHYINNDSFLRPSMVSSCTYDIIFASLNTETPLKYEVNYRNYLIVTHGKVVIRVFPPKSTKYLYATADYDNLEFISPVNPWNVQLQYKGDFNKLRSMDITLIQGQMIHIPAYWWYSIRFVKSNTTICAFKYKTYMSTLAISNHLCMRLLQRQNTKLVIAKKMDLKSNSYELKTEALLDKKDNKDKKEDNIVVDDSDNNEVKIDIGAINVSELATVKANDDEVIKIEL